MMTADEERIALFLDYENLAIGAREDLRGARFDLRPVADALADRGRVVVRRAYADWSSFDDDRRMLTTEHVELIEIPQRMGAVRKNAADIKMAVDAIELCFERDYITTYVIGTGDSDFTPLVAKLRELNRRVIGLGLQASTSALLPPACDEFLFYERLEGVHVPEGTGKGAGRRRGGRGARPGGRPGRPAGAGPASAGSTETQTAGGQEPAAVGAAAQGPAADRTPAEAAEAGEAGQDAAEQAREDTREVGGDDEPRGVPAEPPPLAKLVTQTLAGLQRSSGGAVLASNLKRAMLRKDPTFSEADYGFRAFGELLRHLADRKVIELTSGPAKGDPEVGFPERSSSEEDAFALLTSVVAELTEEGGAPPLSGLKDQLRKRDPAFSEKEFGFGGFLQFVKAARTRGSIAMVWDEEVDDYVLSPAGSAPAS